MPPNRPSLPAAAWAGSSRPLTGGSTALSKTMTVNTLTADEKEVFRKAAVPAVKTLIVEKFGPEGEALLNDFLATLSNKDADLQTYRCSVACQGRL